MSSFGVKQSVGQQLTRCAETNRLDKFERYPSELRPYIRYTYNLKRVYRSVLSFVQHERLRWEAVAPSGDVPFTNPNDYKILYNDRPYGVDKAAITHLVVWTKFLLEEDQSDGDLAARARQVIERFVAKTFCGVEGVPRASLVWFKNWNSLKSVHAIEHFHVMLHNAPSDFLETITEGDKSMSVIMQD